MTAPARAAGPFSAWEIGLAIRYLRAKRKEGGVATIAVISFIGIMLAVAVLISVMSIMSGFGPNCWAGCCRSTAICTSRGRC